MAKINIPTQKIEHVQESPAQEIDKSPFLIDNYEELFKYFRVSATPNSSNNSNNVVAYITVEIFGLVVKGLKLIATDKNEKGVFLSFPSYRTTNADGENIYKNTVFALTKELREWLTDCAIDAYNLAP